MEWQSIEHAPKDGTWILGLNNEGQCAVIAWQDRAFTGDGRGPYSGWIHPFSDGTLSTFWNGGSGSVAIAWTAIPHGEDAASLVARFRRS